MKIYWGKKGPLVKIIIIFDKCVPLVRYAFPLKRHGTKRERMIEALKKETLFSHEVEPKNERRIIILEIRIINMIFKSHNLRVGGCSVEERTNEGVNS